MCKDLSTNKLVSGWFSVLEDPQNLPFLEILNCPSKNIPPVRCDVCCLHCCRQVSLYLGLSILYIPKPVTHLHGTWESRSCHALFGNRHSRMACSVVSSSPQILHAGLSKICLVRNIFRTFKQLKFSLWLLC